MLSRCRGRTRRLLRLLRIPSLDELRLLIADFIKDVTRTAPGDAANK
jgi:hypothetical protein